MKQEKTNIILSRGKVLLCGALIPESSTLVVDLNAMPAGIKTAEIVLGLGIFIFCELLQLLSSMFIFPSEITLPCRLNLGIYFSRNFSRIIS